MHTTNRSAVLESGLALGHAMASSKSGDLDHISGMLRSLGLEPAVISRFTAESSDIGPEAVIYLERTVEGLHSDRRAYGSWLLVGFYTVYLLSRADDVIQDTHLGSTLKNAFEHLLGSYRQWLLKAGVPKSDVSRIAELVRLRFGGSLDKKATVITTVLDELREEATRQDEQPVSHGAAIQSRNPWISGSFYLVSIIVLLACISTVAYSLPLIALPIILLGGVLLVITVGVLQLRSDQNLREETFASLIIEVLKRLPLLGKLRGHWK